MADEGGNGKRFEGYAEATFDALDKRICRLEGVADRIETTVNDIKVKVYSGAAIISLLVTIVVLLVSNGLK